MFPDNICQNIDILVVINVQKNNFGFHSNQKTQEQEHRLNNLYFKYQVCEMKLRHLNTFLQFRLLFQEPHVIRNRKKEGRVIRGRLINHDDRPCLWMQVSLVSCHASTPVFNRVLGSSFHVEVCYQKRFDEASPRPELLGNTTGNCQSVYQFMCPSICL